MALTNPNAQPFLKERMGMNVQKEGLGEASHGLHANRAPSPRCRGRGLEG